MAKYSLTAHSALMGLDIEKQGFRLTELTDIALVAMAVPNGGEEKLSVIIEKVFKIQLPDTGCSVTSEIDDIRFCGMQHDQYFVQFKYSADRTVDVLHQYVDDSAYLSDQSDSWVIVRVTGKNTLSMLERICPLDLDISVFPAGAVARTSMHHLAVIIIREDVDSFQLLSHRSSAESFLHALDVTVL